MIRLTLDGFSLIGDDGTGQQVPWTSVKEVFAFKVDLLTYDTIRLAFRVSDDGTYWEVDEDDPGFGELLSEVQRRLGTLDKDWWAKVAFPPFVANRTTLWGEQWTGPHNRPQPQSGSPPGPPGSREVAG